MRVGDYEIVGELGRGAMGVVYRARHAELGRDAAIKVVKTGSQAGVRAARFVREGQLSATLNHPGIVRVHSAGESELGLYLAYELVEDARTLDEAMDHATLAQRIAWVRDIARALGYAHARGVVHRDVKPANVLVCADGQVKVADFGLAVARGAEKLTQTGAFLGTPNYMSPEAVRGETRDVGAPTDVWALGVLLYEAISGRVPFDAHAVVELAAKITSVAAPRLTPRPGESVDPDVARICYRALAKDPAQRYPDGEAMAAELDRALDQSSSPGPNRAATRRALASLAVVIPGLVLWFGLSSSKELAKPPDRSARARPLIEGAELHPKLARSAEWTKQGQRLARRLDRLEDPDALREAGEAWLARYEGHARFLAVRALVAKARWQTPVAVLRHDGWRAQGVFLGSGLATWGTDGTIRLWDRETRAQVTRWDAGRALLSGSRMGPDGLALIAGEPDNEARRAVYFSTELARVAGNVWTGDPTLAPRHEARNVLDGAWVVTASPDGRFVIVASENGRWEQLDERGAVLTAGQSERAIAAAAFSPDGRTLALLTTALGERRPNLLEVWPLSATIGRRVGEQSQITLPNSGGCLTFSPDSQTIAIGFLTGAVGLFRLDGTGYAVLTPFKGSIVAAADATAKWVSTSPFVRDLTFSPDGRWIYTVAGGDSSSTPPVGNELLAWNVATRRLDLEAVRQSHRLISVDASADDRWLLVGTENGGVQLRHSRPDTVYRD